MHEQQDGAPTNPPRSFPPPPAYPPPPAPRPSRAGLWVALGVVAALVAGGGLYALTNSHGQAAPQGGVAQSAAGGAPAAGDAGGQPVSQVRLPDSFLGMRHNDDTNAGRLLKLQGQRLNQDPNLHVSTAFYAGGQFGARFMTVVAVVKDSAFTAQEHSVGLAKMWQMTDTPDVKITHGPVTDADPGPLGGTMQCAHVYTQTSMADALGNHVQSGIQCAWIDDSTWVVVSEGDPLTGGNISKAGDIARQFRAQAETRG
ncbi:hypothetical protein ACIG5E_25480 [Kitasatospora sp. NPDC053057]|uniref:hypothetical protein n=1 Tax=Kitasatospora sp. NPDC053057 TaxID=3364062 RepID=UPI0037CBF5E2